ncbi:MAG: Ig-like domain-containing protein [Gemmatimonadales bacterium]
MAATLGCGGDLTLPDPVASGFSLSIVRGNGQTGTVGQALPEFLVVKVVSESNTPIPGREVAFVLSGAPAGGQLDPDTAVTNSQGEAIARWILGTAPGDHAVEARLVVAAPAEPPVARFEASAVAGAPDTLRAESPLSQPGRRGQALPDPLVVRVVDRFGNPVAEVEVRWEVLTGKGELSESETLTDSDGTASVSWTLGNRIGLHKVTAEVEGIYGSPVTFTATVLF